MLGVTIELWLNPEKNYRPERYMFSNAMFTATKDFNFKNENQVHSGAIYCAFFLQLTHFLLKSP